MKSKSISYKRKDELWGYLFIAPQYIGIICFILLPVLASLYISFTEWDFVNIPKWTGLQNYKTILKDPLTLKVLKNTFTYVLAYIPLNLVLSLLLAMALNTTIRGKILYRTAYFLPTVTSSVAVALLWTWLYNPDFGLINVALSKIGIKGPGWTASTKWALPSIVIMTVWQGIGYNMVIFLAGLQAIPRSLYEAATIDGANSWMRFKKITLPMLSPTTFFVVIMMLIGSFQIFNEPYMMTRGGPADATNVIVMYIYNLAFQFFRMGEASVVSWILFVIILLVTLLQFKYSKKWVNYDV